jgi:hypothetical protein
MVAHEVLAEGKPQSGHDLVAYTTNLTRVALYSEACISGRQPCAEGGRGDFSSAFCALGWSSLVVLCLSLTRIARVTYGMLIARSA